MSPDFCLNRIESLVARSEKSRIRLTVLNFTYNVADEAKVSEHKNDQKPSSESKQHSPSSLSYSQAKEPPGPRGHWFWGNLLERRHNALNFFYESAMTYGPVVKMRFGPVRAYLITQPEHVKHIFLGNYKNYDKGFGLKKSKVVLGENVLTSSNFEWAPQRKLVQPAFNHQKIDKFAELIVTATTDFVERWKRAPQNEIDFVPEMKHVTLRIISRAMFSHDSADFENIMHESLEEVTTEVTKRTLSFTSIREWLPSKTRTNFNINVSRIHGIVNKIILERKNGPKNENADDLLSILMQAQDAETGVGLTDESLRNQLLAILIAGHETSAGSMCWMLKLLDEHPEVYKNLVGEIETVLGGRPATLADLKQLKYPRMVINETLRLYPAVWTISRETLKDDIIGGFKIKKGSVMQVCPYVTHRLTEFWDKPMEFIPERWAEDIKSTPVPKYAYYPFGAGPRACLGDQFAMLELQLILITMLQKLDFKLLPNQKVTAETKIVVLPRPTLKTQLRFK